MYLLCFSAHLSLYQLPLLDLPFWSLCLCLSPFPLALALCLPLPLGTALLLPLPTLPILTLSSLPVPELFVSFSPCVFSLLSLSLLQLSPLYYTVLTVVCFSIITLWFTILPIIFPSCFWLSFYIWHYGNCLLHIKCACHLSLPTWGGGGLGSCLHAKADPLILGNGQRRDWLDRYQANQSVRVFIVACHEYVTIVLSDHARMSWLCDSRLPE